MMMAQQIVESVSGAGSGWAGAGLLGAVLCWLLLRHLPEKDRLIQSIIADHDRVEKDQRAEYLQSLKEHRLEFKSMIDSVPKCGFIRCDYAERINHDRRPVDRRELEQA